MTNILRKDLVFKRLLISSTQNVIGKKAALTVDNIGSFEGEIIVHGDVIANELCGDGIGLADLNKFNRGTPDVIYFTNGNMSLGGKDYSNRLTVNGTVGINETLITPSIISPEDTLQFITRNGTQFVITNMSKFGVNTDNPRTKFDIDGSVTVHGDVVINGEFAVTGEVTLIDSRNFQINNSLLILGVNNTSSTQDIGFIVERGDEDNVGFIWDEEVDEFAIINTSSVANTLSIDKNNYGDMKTGQLLMNNELNASFYFGNGSLLQDVLAEHNRVFKVEFNNNKLVIDGIQQRTLSLMMGQSYKFDLSYLEASQSFTISTSPEGGSNNILFNTNVVGNGNNMDSASPELIFKVPLDIPMKLYYQSNEISFAGSEIYFEGIHLHDGNHDTEVLINNVGVNDTIHFITAGNDTMIIDMNGNVGICKVMPTERLDIEGNVGISGDILVKQTNQQNIGSSDLWFNRMYTNELIQTNTTLTLNNQEIITSVNGIVNTTVNLSINSVIHSNDTYVIENGNFVNINKWKGNESLIRFVDGNVGIGTTSPDHKLTVGINTTVEGDIYVPAIKVNDINLFSLTRSIWSPIVNTGDINYEYGNVGINKDRPIHKLDVGGVVNATTYHGDASFVTDVPVDIWTGPSYNTLSVVDGNVSVVNRSVNIEYMNGNVGLGVSAPRDRLEIDGAFVVGKTDYGTNGTIRFTNTIRGPQHPNLLSWWRLDEIAGTIAIDNSPNSNDATVINGDNSNWTMGKLGGALQLNINNMDEFLNGPNIDLENKYYSISFWIKRNINNADETIISQGTNGLANKHLQIKFNVGNNVIFGFGSDDLISTSIHNNIEDWNHYVFTYDACTKNRIIYVNGVRDSIDIAVNNYIGTGNLNVGRNVGGTEYFNGLIDDIRVFSTVLTYDDAVSLYTADKSNDVEVFTDGKWNSLTTNVKPPKLWDISYNKIVSGLDATKIGDIIKLPVGSPEIWNPDVVNKIIVFDDKSEFVILSRDNDRQITVESLRPINIRPQPYKIIERRHNDIVYNPNCLSHYVGIGTNTPQYDLDINGNVSINGNLMLNGELLTANMTELNTLSGITANVLELNRMLQANVSRIELNHMDGVLEGIAVSERVLVTDINNNLNFGDGSLIVGELHVKNNMRIIGNDTIINTKQFKVNNSLIFLNEGGIGNNTKDIGLFIERPIGINISIMWDESANEMSFINTTSMSTDSELVIDSYLNTRVENYRSDTNITAINYYGDAGRLDNILTNHSRIFTVVGNTSSGRISVDGIEGRKLNLIRGKKYKFELDDLTDDHPFIISSSPHGGNSIGEYLIGVIGNGSTQSSNPATLVFDIPHKAKGPLYYQSALVSDKGGLINIGDIISDADEDTFVSTINDSIHFVAQNNTGVIINTDGRIGINVMEPTEILDVGGNISISGTLIPEMNGTINLGNPTRVWKDVFINDLFLSGSTIKVGDNTVVSTINGNLTVTLPNIVTTVINTTNVFVSENNNTIDLNKWRGTDNLNFMKGNVGIGTLTPTSKLHVIGNTSINGSLYTERSMIYGAEINSTPNLMWSASGQNLFYDAGNVGIHNNNPQFKLDVSGVVNANYLCGDGQFLTNVPEDYWIGPNNQTIVYNNNETRLIDSNANIHYIGSNVGFGTTTPIGQFEINGAIVISKTKYDIPTDGTIHWDKSVIDSNYYSLLAWYKLNTGVGTVAIDESENINNGTMVNMDNSNWVSGIIGNNSVNFNGIDEYINVTNSILLALESFTISIWVKRGTIGTVQTLIGHGTSSTNNNLNIGFNSDNTLTFGFLNNDLTTTTTFTDTINWHHLVFAFNKINNYRYIYFDAVLDDTDIATNIYQGIGDFFIGHTITGTNYFNGNLDDIRIYNKYIDIIDVTYLYNIENKSDFKVYLNNKWESLTIKRPEPALLWIQNTTTNNIVFNPTSAVDEVGRIGIGKKTSPNYIVDINGNVGISGILKLNGVDLIATPSELNTMNGTSVTPSELNVLQGATFTADDLNELSYITPGLVSTNRVLVANETLSLTIGTVTINNLTIERNMTTVGQLTHIHSNNMIINDSLILVGQEQVGLSPKNDSGLIINRGTSDNVGIIWDESVKRFALISTNDDGTTKGNISEINYEQLHANNINVVGNMYTNNIIGNGSQLTGINIVKWYDDTNLYRPNGSVGISTDSPQHTLDINGSVYINYDTNTVFSENININSIKTNTLHNRLHINTSTNYIGINDITPSVRFDINGTLNINKTIRIVSDLEQTNNVLGKAILTEINTDTDTETDTLNIRTNEFSRFVIEADSGNIQINRKNKNSVYKVDINNTTLIQGKVGINTNNLSEELVINGVANGTYLYGNGTYLTGTGWEYNNGNVVRIETNNIGIGTTTPTTLLDINGYIRSDIYSGDGDALHDVVWSNESSGLYIHGNVGINMESTLYAVEVNGFAHGINLIGNGSGVSNASLWITNGVNDLKFISGNVGINMKNPYKTFIVNGTTHINTNILHDMVIIEQLSGHQLLNINTTLKSLAINAITSNPYELSVNGSMKANDSLLIGINNLDNNLLLDVKLQNTHHQSNLLNVSSIINGSIFNKFIIEGESGKIGINNMNPAYTVDINGSMRVSDRVYIQNSNKLNSGEQLNINGIANATNWSGNGSVLNSMLWNNSSILQNIGIGTTTPSEKLDVIGSVNATGFIGNGSLLSNLIWRQEDNEISYFGGYIGIGTTVPEYDVDIVGTVRVNRLIGDGSNLTNVTEWFKNIPDNVVFKHNGSIGINAVPQDKSIFVNGTVNIANGTTAALTVQYEDLDITVSLNNNNLTLGTLSDASFGVKSIVTTDNQLFMIDETHLGNIINIYDIPSNSWTYNTLSTNLNNSAIGYANNNVVIAGDIVDVYNKQTNIWLQTTMSVPRTGLSAVGTDTQILFIGGEDVTTTITNRIDIYDTVDNSWSVLTLSTGYTEMKDNCAILNNVLYVAGGGINGRNNVDIYDTINDIWTVTTIADPKTNMIVLSEYPYVVFGPGKSSSSTVSDKIDVYDVRYNTWKVINIPVAKHNYAAGLFDHKLIIAGGATDATETTIVNTIDIYDFDNSTWTVTTLTKKLQKTSGKLQTYFDNKYQLIIAGGIDDGNIIHNSIETLEWNVTKTTVDFMTVDSVSNRIGLLNQNPATTLDIYGNLSINNYLYIGDRHLSDINLGLSVNSSNYESALHIKHDTNTLMYLNSTTHNIGIGQTDASEQLDILGTTCIGNKVGINNAIGVDEVIINGNVNASIFYTNGSLLTGIKWNYNGNDLIRSEINNVGIGTITPSELLDINGNVNSSGFIGNGSLLEGVGWNDISGGISFSRGNVGIGILSPKYILDVNGVIKADIAIGDGTELTNVSIWNNNTIGLDYIEGNIGINVIPNHTLHIVGKTLFKTVDSDKVFDISRYNIDGNKTTSLTVTPSRNIGILLDNPGYTLHVNSTIHVTDELIIGDGQLSNVDGDMINVLGDNNQDPLHIHNGISTIIYVNTLGNIGINTTNPTVEFTVNGDMEIGTKLSVCFSSAQFSQTDNGLTVNGSVNSTYYNGPSLLAAPNAVLWTESSGDLYRLGNVSIGSKIMNDALNIEGSLKSSILIGNGTEIYDHTWGINNGYRRGNVGIGLEKPTVSLDVKGAIKATEFIGNGSNIANVSDWILVDNDIQQDKYIGIDIVEETLTSVHHNVVSNYNTQLNGANITNHITNLTHPYKCEAATSSSVGDIALFAGGRDDSSVYHNDVNIMEYGIGFTIQSTLSASVYRLTSVSYEDKIYIAGGKSTNPTYYSNYIDIYDTRNKTWEHTTMSIARNGLASAAINGVIMFAGGEIYGGKTNRIDILNVRQNIWSQTTISQKGRGIVAAAAGNKILIAGGLDSSRTDKVDIYDTVTDIWTHTTLSSVNAFMSVIGTNNYIVIAGGHTNTETIDNVDIYNTVTDTWTHSTLSAARYANNYSGVALNNLMIFPGGDITGTGVTTNIIDIYDTNINTWYQSTLNHSLTSWTTATKLHNNQLIAIGGTGGVNNIDIIEFEVIQPEFTTLTSTNQLHRLNIRDTILTVKDDLDYSGTFIEDNVLLLPVIESQTVKTYFDNITRGNAVSIDNYALFIGGRNNSNVYQNSVKQYTYPDSYAANNHILSQNADFPSVVALGRKIYIAGGELGSNNYTNLVNIYDVDTRVWTTATLSLNRRLIGIGATNGVVMFAGGLDTGNIRTNIIDIYNVNTDKWSVSTLSDAVNFNMGGQTNTEIIFAGGVTDANASNKVDIYNTVTNIWSHTTLSSITSSNYAASSNQYVMFAGGNNGTTAINNVDIYNGNTKTWIHTTLAEAVTSNTCVGMNNLLISVGGYNSSNVGVNNIEIYDITTNEWSYTTLTYTATAYNAATYVHDNRLIVQGGQSTTSISTAVNTMNFIDFKVKRSRKLLSYDADNSYKISQNRFANSLQTNLPSYDTKISKLNKNKTTELVAGNTINDTVSYNMTYARKEIQSISNGHIGVLAGGIEAYRSNKVDILNTKTNSLIVTTLTAPANKLSMIKNKNKVYIGAGNIDYAFKNKQGDLQIYNTDTGEWDYDKFNSSFGNYNGKKIQNVNNVQDEDIIYEDGVHKYLTNNFTETVTTLSQARKWLFTESVNGITVFAGGTVDGTNAVSTVDIYNANTDTWTETTLDVPRDMNSYATKSAGRIGSKIFIPGGRNNNAVVYNNIDVYDTDTGEWTMNFATLGEPRSLIATAYSERYIFFASGFDGTNCSGYVDLYDSHENVWYDYVLSEARNHCNSVYVNNKFYVIGGKNNSGTIVNTIDVLDTIDLSWSVMTLAVAKRYHNTEVIGDKIYVVGGDPSSNLIEIYDTITDNWTYSTLSSAKNQVTSAVTNNILFVGSSSTFDNSIDIYNSVTDTWSISTMTNGFNGPSVKLDESRIIGGGGNNVTNNVGIYDFKKQFKEHYSERGATIIDEYNVYAGGRFKYLTNDFTETVTTLSQARKWLFTESVNGITVFAGGTVDGTNAVNTVDIYNANTNTWTETTLDVPRDMNSYATKSAGRIGSKIFIPGGGNNNAVVYNNIDVYDTDTGEWTMNFATLGEPRSLIATAYSERYIFFASGFDGTNCSGYVDLYDSHENVWYDYVLSEARNHCNSVYVNNKFYVIGGKNNSGTIVNTIDVLDTIDLSWSVMTLAVAKRYHNTEVIGDKIYVVGGDPSSNLIEIYDTITDNWTYSTLSSAKNQVTSAVTNNILFVGSSSTFDNSIDIYNSVTDTWSISTMTNGFNGPSVKLDESRIIGGGGNNVTNRVVIYDFTTYQSVSSDIEVYNTNYDSWIITTLIKPLYGMKSAFINDNAYFIGGYDTNNNISNIIQIYNPKTNDIVHTYTPYTRDKTAISYSTRYITIAGGLLAGVATNIVEIYDSHTATWYDTKLSQARITDSCTLGNIFVFAGGTDETESVYYNVVDIYNVVTNEWISITLNEARHSASVLALDNNRFAVAGGKGINGVLDTIETFIVDIDSVTESYYDNNLLISNKLRVKTINKHTDKIINTTLSMNKQLLSLYDNYTQNVYVMGHTDKVDIYDIETESLTHDTTPHNKPRWNETNGLSYNNHIVYAGGLDSEYLSSNIVRYEQTTLSSARYNMFTSSFGNIAMFMGGFISSSLSVNTIDIYNSATESWSTSTLSVEKVADTTYNQNGVRIGNELFLGSNRVDIYNIVTDKWSLATLSIVRKWAVSAGSDSHVLFAGGYSIANGYENTVDIFNVHTRVWIATTLSNPVHSSSIVYNNNRFYIAGGEISGGYTDTIDIWNENTNLWSKLVLPLARSRMTGGVLYDKLYFGGGYNGINTNQLDIYNITTDIWNISTLDVSSVYGMVCKQLNNLLVFAGGSTTNTIEIYNGITDMWSYSTLSIARSGHSMTILDDNKLIIAGGDGPHNNVEILTFDNQASNEIGIYNTQTNTWAVSTISYAKDNVNILGINNKIMFINNKQILAKNGHIDIYDIGSDSWTTNTFNQLPSTAPIVHAVLNNKIYMAHTYIYPYSNNIAIYDNNINGWGHMCLPTNRNVGKITTSLLCPYVIFGPGIGNNHIDIYNVDETKWLTVTYHITGLDKYNASIYKNKYIISGGLHYNVKDGYNHIHGQFDMFDIQKGTWSYNLLSAPKLSIQNNIIPTINNEARYLIFGGNDFPEIEEFKFQIVDDDIPLFTVNSTNSFTGINTASPEEKLHVINGDITVLDGSMYVNDSGIIVPDYVFEEDYKLMSIDNLKTYVNTNKHLPDVQNQLSFKQQKGISINKLQMSMLEKIEELSLYKIQHNNIINNININTSELVNMEDINMIMMNTLNL
jgi:hypothetical protein